MLNVICGEPQAHDTLTVFPLVAKASPELPLVLMSDALASGALRITEIGSGTVPELVASNTGSEAVLVLDGEQLIGAKQNRTTNRSMILPAQRETRIPVSCMEHGRWRFDSDEFQPSPQNSPSSVRRKARDLESAYVKQGMAATTEMLSEAQGAVWSEIADYEKKLGVSSDTGALDGLYTSRQQDVTEWLQRFPSIDDQVGLLAFVGPRPTGMDVIGSATLYSRLHERILRGYVMDALAAGGSAAPTKSDQAQSYLDLVKGARRADTPTAGDGTYFVLDGEVVGGELTWNEGLVHLSAFPAQQPGPSHGQRYDSPIQPPSRRRR